MAIAGCRAPAWPIPHKTSFCGWRPGGGGACHVKNRDRPLTLGAAGATFRARISLPGHWPLYQEL